METKYHLKLILANPNVKEGFDKHRKWFEKCVDKFNVKSAESRFNKKRVKIENWGEKDIDILLLTEEPVETPGKALKYLSQQLITEDAIDYDDYYFKSVWHKKLFKISSTAVWEEENSDIKHIDPIVVKDSDLIKSLIDYLEKPKNPYTPEINVQKKAVEKMKILAIECGLIEIY